MVYVRAKRVKSDQYLYLVRSVWDPKKATSRQEIVKYLGKASGVVKDDIPPEYRDDPKILAALAAHSPEDAKKRQDTIARAKAGLFGALVRGSIADGTRIYEDHARLFSPASFFERVLRPVMHKVGEDWAAGRMSIATEHVASNVAQALVRSAMEGVTGSGRRKKKVVICVPAGEEHRIGCDVLEAYLSAKGFLVYNMGTSVPTESILGFIKKNKPDAVLLSITLPENIAAGGRLARKIRERTGTRVLAGGYAFADGAAGFDGPVIKDARLDGVPRALAGTA